MNGTEIDPVAQKDSGKKNPCLFARFYGTIKVLMPRRRNREASLREAVEEMIKEPIQSGNIPSAERMLLSNILRMRERTVADCMVPRADIVAMEIGCDSRQLLELMAQHAHSRIPVYRETLDETVGMVHMKDVLAHMANGEEFHVRELLRPVLFVVPSMPVSRLLLQMRQSRRHMAMVVDEFGGIDGLVTIEDLVEEIVGEIEDEHDDPAEPDIIARPDGTLLLDGRLAVSEFENRFGPVLAPEERETIDTLGGYVFHLAGHVPQIGEAVPGPNGLIFEVLETDQNRIKRVRVRNLRR